MDLLSSVDGTPSLPVSLSWVRDGILVVGMDCEMHVYAQWRQDRKPGEAEGDSLSSEDNIAGGVGGGGGQMATNATTGGSILVGVQGAPPVQECV